LYGVIYGYVFMARAKGVLDEGAEIVGPWHAWTVLECWGRDASVWEF
jgi:hypothetical protein